MRVDYRRHVILLRDVVDEVVDNERGFRVKSRVRFVAKQVFGVQGDGAGYGHSLLHAAREFAGGFALRFDEVDAVEAELGAAHAVFVRVGREHVEREHHVLQHAHRVEEGGILEYHAHLAADLYAFLLVHPHVVASIVEHIAGGGFQQSHDALHQHRLSGAALTDNQVGQPVFEACRNVAQHFLVAKRLAEGLYFNHLKKGFV